MSKNIARMAAARSGKTYTICREAEERLKELRSSGDRYGKILMVTYTNRAVASLESELRKGNLGVIPNGIVVFSWFSFLIQELIKPYQAEMFGINSLKGMNFNLHEQKNNYFGEKNPERYKTSHGDINSDQAAELVHVLNDEYEGALIHRVEGIYRYVFIDEFQDLCGHDLYIVEELMKSKSSVTIVGDGKQALFKTNSSTKNKGKSGKNLWEYFQDLERRGLARVESQNISRRFNSEICCFANKVSPSQTRMGTCMKVKTEHDGVFLIRHEDVNAYCQYFHPVVLKYDKKTDTYGLESFNFGECKGDTFDRVLIFPNGPLKKLLLKGEKLSSPEKYYVAVTRPRYSIAIVMDEKPTRKEEFEKVTLNLNGQAIKAFHWIPSEEHMES